MLRQNFQEKSCCLFCRKKGVAAVAINQFRCRYEDVF